MRKHGGDGMYRHKRASGDIIEASSIRESMCLCVWVYTCLVRYRMDGWMEVDGVEEEDED